MGIIIFPHRRSPPVDRYITLWCAESTACEKMVQNFRKKKCECSPHGGTDLCKIQQSEIEIYLLLLWVCPSELHTLPMVNWDTANCVHAGYQDVWGNKLQPASRIYSFISSASCKIGTGSFSRVKCGRGVLLTTHPLLVLWSWNSRAIPLPTVWATPGL